MKTNSKKTIELITLDAEIMDCFDNNEELAVITGGKGVLESLKELIGINGGNCSCTNGNCGC